jgi:UDPglucose 6-dehydrogenase/GDP-mannose 6-dehydrogenase
MRVSVVGAGYVGLVTGVCLADRGHHVVCVDQDRSKLAAIEARKPLIHEEGLEALIDRTVGRSFHVTEDLAAAVRETDLTIVAVGTPSTPDGIDLRHVLAAASQVGAALAPGGRFHAVVVKSTVIPGSTDAMVVPELERASGMTAGEGFGVGVNPEFLTEGRAVRDFTEPDRIVIGAGDPRTEAMLRELYACFPDAEVVATNTRTAEMIKYASNALLATSISFANELANLGAAIGGIDTTEVMRGVHASRYLTTRTASGAVVADLSSFLLAGCGFGGSCLPKDVTALVAAGRGLGSPMRLLEAVLEVNARQPELLVDLVRGHLGGLGGRAIGVLGLAFKPDTNDTRESPAFPVIRRLSGEGARVLAHDPVVHRGELPPDIAGMVELRDDLAALVGEVDALVLVTSWSHYRSLPELLAATGASPLVVDGRRVLDPTSVPRYAGIGR